MCVSVQHLGGFLGPVHSQANAVGHVFLYITTYDFRPPILRAGVLTKLDIMDRGTSAAHILRNAHIPLRLGYVGVVLRCQEEINNRAPMSEARRWDKGS